MPLASLLCVAIKKNVVVVVVVLFVLFQFFIIFIFHKVHKVVSTFYTDNSVI